jgi:hypothetical protein
MEALIRRLPKISSEQAIIALNPIADEIRESYTKLDDGDENVRFPYPMGVHIDLERFEEAVTDVMATQFQLPFEVIERSKEGFTIGIAA